LFCLSFRSQPDVFGVIHSQTAAMEVLQQVCIAADGFDHPGFKKLASKLGVKRFAEVTQHEVAAEDLLALLARL